MSIVFNESEAICLILEFYTYTRGYWKFNVSEYPEAVKFINAGYAELDDSSEKYVLNTDGASLLHSFIEKITIEFINYLKKNGNDSTFGEIEEWYQNRYQFSDVGIASGIREYIAINAINYGFKVEEIHIQGNFSPSYELKP